MPRADLLLVSLGTTLGWRRADRLFLEQLERAGARTEAVSVSFGLAARLRRGYPVNDLVEMHAARRALLTALARHEPRAIVISSTTAAMALPRIPMPYAVRLDAPARMNRPGARNAVLHALERRGLGRARLTLPLSHAAVDELPAGSAPAVVVSPPVEPSGPPSDEREQRRRGLRARPQGEGPRRTRRGLGRRGAPGCAARGVWARSASGRAPTCAGRRSRATWPRAARHRPGGRVPRPHSCRARLSRPERAGRTSARRRWRRWPTARCSRRCRPAGPFEALRLALELERAGLVASALDGAGARERNQGRLRAARGARARLPRRGARAPAPVQPGGGAGDRRTGRAAAAPRLAG